MKQTIPLSEYNPFVRYIHRFNPSTQQATQMRCCYDARCFLLNRGSATVIAEQTPYVLFPNRVVLLPGGTSYRFSDVAEDTEIIGVNFDYTQNGACRRQPICPVPPHCFAEEQKTENIRFSDFTEGNVPFYSEQVRDAAELLESAEAAYGTLLPTSDALASAYLKLLLTKIAANCLKKQYAVSEAAERASEFIRHHYREAISNEDIARAVCFHPNYLNRVMRRSTGYTLHGYLIHYRLHCAMRMLQNTALSVCEIAEQTGFGDIWQFSKAFRTETGFSPSEYRKMN